VSIPRGRCSVEVDVCTPVSTDRTLSLRLGMSVGALDGDDCEVVAQVSTMKRVADQKDSLPLYQSGIDVLIFPHNCLISWLWARTFDIFTESRCPDKAQKDFCEEGVLIYWVNILCRVCLIRADLCNTLCHQLSVTHERVVADVHAVHVCRYANRLHNLLSMTQTYLPWKHVTDNLNMRGEDGQEQGG
jgi:hypothetical protein